MKKITYARRVYLTSGVHYYWVFHRGGARNAAISILNYGDNPFNYNVNKLWVPPYQFDLDILALSPRSFFPMVETVSPFTNTGTAGGTAPLYAGSIVNNNAYPSTMNVSTVHSIATGSVHVATASLLSSGGSWAYGTWFYPTLITGTMALYSEANAAVTHIFQTNVTPAGQMGFYVTNGGTPVSVVLPGAGRVVTNAWNLCIWQWASGTLTGWLNGNSVGTVACAANLFVDANNVIAGIVSGGYGYTSQPFIFQNAAPMTSEYSVYLYDDNRSRFSLSLNQGTITSGSAINLTYGEGTTQELPNLFFLDILAPSGDTTFDYIWTMEG